MDYKSKYLKYKTKYLKLSGGNKYDTCDTKFQDLMDIKIEDTDYKIYQGSINESPCELDKEYANCKKYLDGLNLIQEFILWTYTDGALARLLNNYLLLDKKIDTFYDSPRTLFTICLQIKWYYFYELDIKVIADKDNDNIKDIKLLFEKIIVLIWDNFKIINRRIIKNDLGAINKMDKGDTDLLKEFVKIINSSPRKDPTNSEKVNLMKQFFIELDCVFPLKYPLEYIFDYIINDIDKTILSSYIDLHLKCITTILEGAPPIDRCIKLYKIIGKKTDLYEIGSTYKQKVINSLTCSRTANISIFYDRDKQPCCFLEINCIPGTKVLFLNYLKTAYGSNVFEVILPAGYNFKVDAEAIKDIVTYEFGEKFLKPKTKVIQPIRTLSYKKPEIKKIKVYEISIV